MRRQDDRGGRRYWLIADQLRTEIADGTHPAGGKLPTERDLAERFGVSRPTVRHAIAVLRTEGLIDARQGSGLHVRPSNLPSSVHTLRRTRQDATGEAGSDLVAIRAEIWTSEEPAPERIAATLGLVHDERTAVRRCLVSSSERPLHLATTYRPAASAAAGAVTREEGALVERISVRMPTEEESGQLALRAGTPVIELTRPSPQALELTIVVLASDAYELLYELP